MKTKMLGKVKTFSTVVVREIDNPDADDEDRALIGTTQVVWTDLLSPEDELAPYEIRGLLRPGGNSLAWLPEDTVVEVVEKRRMLGRPEALIADAAEARARTRDLYSSGAVPELIDLSEPVISAVENTQDPEIAVQDLLFALSVAPDDAVVRDMMIAALAARYASVQRNPKTYPPGRHPWAKLN